MPRKRKDDPFVIGPTALMAWRECPAKLWWSQRWALRREPDNFGSQVHRHMESGTDYDSKKDFEAVGKILPKMRQIEEQLGYTVLAREVSQWWELEDWVIFHRTIDLIVRLPTGKLSIVDYKSSSKPWRTMTGGNGEVFSPKAHTLQVAGYLLPPAPSVPQIVAEKLLTIGEHNWPKQFIFINGPAEGDPRWFPPVERNDYDERVFGHFLNQSVGDLDYMRQTGVVLRNSGDACDNRWTGARGQTYGWACPWLEMCHELPGWRSKYKLRSLYEHKMKKGD